MRRERLWKAGRVEEKKKERALERKVREYEKDELFITRAIPKSQFSFEVTRRLFVVCLCLFDRNRRGAASGV